MTFQPRAAKSPRFLTVRFGRLWTARQVGVRKARPPVILTVKAREAYEQGVQFYRGNDLVWLADEVPPLVY